MSGSDRFKMNLKLFDLITIRSFKRNMLVLLQVKVQKIMNLIRIVPKQINS